MSTRLLIGQSVAVFLRNESRRRYPTETGGVLAGYRDVGAVVVTHATGPGPRADRGRSHFRRDGDHSQGAVDRVFDETAGASDYVGEWHSHPFPFGPSAADIAAMSWIACNPEYRRPNPVLLICQRTKWRTWRLLAYEWRGGDLAPVRLRILSTSRARSSMHADPRS